MQVNRNGVISLFLITVLIILILVIGGSNYFLYAVLAILGYVASIFYLTVTRPGRRFTRKQRPVDKFLDSSNSVLGVHLAFVLLIFGIVLGLNFFLQIVYFVVAIIIGIMLPFILLADARNT